MEIDWSFTELLTKDSCTKGKTKAEASAQAIPIPEDIQLIIEAWREVCPETSPDALMFQTSGRGPRENETVPRHAKNFLRWRIHSIAKRLGIPTELVTFQEMRRTLRTDLQQYGTMKDAQQILRQAKHPNDSKPLHAADPGECSMRG